MTDIRLALPLDSFVRRGLHLLSLYGLMCDD
jgi:hypothetical protein